MNESIRIPESFLGVLVHDRLSETVEAPVLACKLDDRIIRSRGLHFIRDRKLQVCESSFHVLECQGFESIFMATHGSANRD